MKKILYLSFYFEPDLCAGSFRNSPLARELAKQVKGKATVDIITTVPNRYSSFSAEAPQDESEDNLRIRRIKLPLHKSGFVDQIKAFYKYYREVKKMVKGNDYDLVFASSSRLFTAYLGYRIASRRKIPLYLDIRDIFTDTLNDVITNSLIKFFLLPLLRRIEASVFGYASHINLISEGFTGYFSKYSNPKYSYYTNGIDQEFVQASSFEELLPPYPITITYAGNIGESQALHKIIPKVALELGEGFRFRIIGDGGARHLLENKIRNLGLTNVFLEKPVKRSEVINIYKQSHYLFIHLSDSPAFEKVLPSKIFELDAFPRPIIAGVNGFAKEFILSEVSNTILLEPCNYNEFVFQIRNNEFKVVKRGEFIEKHSRKVINANIAKSICGYL